MPKVLVKHSGKTHDVSRFLHFHPGGSNTIRTFEGCDITAQLEKTHHSPAAYNLLKDYKVREENDKSQEFDLESLVNWDKAMFWQVGSLGSDYSKWVLAPVDRKLRLFQYDFMERLTVTPWYLVPLVWLPVTTYMIYCGYELLRTNSPFDTLSNTSINIIVFLTVVLGYFIWPLIEYSIHRWLFHMDPPANSPLLITLHFTIHGLHHKKQRSQFLGVGMKIYMRVRLVLTSLLSFWSKNVFISLKSSYVILYLTIWSIIVDNFQCPTVVDPILWNALSILTPKSWLIFAKSCYIPLTLSNFRSGEWYLVGNEMNMILSNAVVVFFLSFVVAESSMAKDIYLLSIVVDVYLPMLSIVVPFDSQRLLFPPTASALVISFMYGLLRLFLPTCVVLLLVAGGTLGYVTYDLIHFYLHYGSPSEGSYFYFMKRYHNQHHFTQHQSGFGISTPMWDQVFSTKIALKECKYHLKW